MTPYTGYPGVVLPFIYFIGTTKLTPIHLRLTLLPLPLPYYSSMNDIMLTLLTYTLIPYDYARHLQYNILNAILYSGGTWEGLNTFNG